MHKAILDVPLPRFDAGEAAHVALSVRGRAAAEKGRAWVAGLVPGPKGLPSVGRLRSGLRAHLGPELKAIDRALKTLI